MAGNIPLLLEIGPEKLLDDARLHLGRFALAELDQPVRVARVARLAAEFEVDADGFAHGRETLEDGCGSFRAEFLGVVGALVDAGFRGVRVEVEGEPGGGEGVGGVGVEAFVGGYAGFEFVLADVALGVWGLARGILGGLGGEGRGLPMGRQCLRRWRC